MSTTLVIGGFTPSVLLAVARRRGRLDEEDLQVTEVPVASSPAQFRSLLDGDIHGAFTSPDNVVAYRFGKDNPLGVMADVTIVSTVDRGMGLGLYLRPGLQDPERLRGATVAVDVATSGFALAMYALGESVGVARDEYQLVALGSTPKRLKALLAGECDATMLNAGNELYAEQAGCRLVARAVDVCSPYIGTVLSVAGNEHLGPVRRLAAALRRTAQDICSGTIDDEVVATEATSALGLPRELAGRYVARLKDPGEGLILEEHVDRVGLTTVVNLRRRFHPYVADGVDLLGDAVSPGSGLIADDETGR